MIWHRTTRGCAPVRNPRWHRGSGPDAAATTEIKAADRHCRPVPNGELAANGFGIELRCKTSAVPISPSPKAHIYFSVSCQTPFQSAGTLVPRRSWRRRRNTIAGPSIGITAKHCSKHRSTGPSRARDKPQGPRQITRMTLALRRKGIRQVRGPHRRARVRSGPRR